MLQLRAFAEGGRSGGEHARRGQQQRVQGGHLNGAQVPPHRGCHLNGAAEDALEPGSYANEMTTPFPAGVQPLERLVPRWHPVSSDPPFIIHGASEGFTPVQVQGLARPTECIPRQQVTRTWLADTAREPCACGCKSALVLHRKPTDLTTIMLDATPWGGGGKKMAETSSRPGTADIHAHTHR